MTRALTLGLVLLATAASAADLSLATRHDELRALDVAPSPASPSRKVQWAPSGNFSALHTRAVFGSETETASRPYAREENKTAAGAGIFLSRDSVEGSLNSAPSLHRFAYARQNPLRYTDPSGNCPNCVAAGIGALVGFGIGFGAGLLDGKSVGDAALVGLGGAAFGGLTGLTMGANLAGGATAWAATTALVGKVGAGAALDASRQGLEMRADPNKKFSYSELAISSLALGGAPTGAAVGQLPNLARTYAAAGVVLGASGVAGGASEVKQAVETRNGNLALLGAFDILMGRAGIKGGAQGLKALEGVVAPVVTPPEPVGSDVSGDGPWPSSPWPQAVLPSGERVPASDYIGGFHGTNVPPEVALESGLPGRGANWNLQSHVEGGTGSAFRGTAPVPQFPGTEGGGPATWAGEGGWVYDIRNVPTFRANTLLEGRIPTPGGYRGNTMTGEVEGAIPSAVPAPKIQRYGKVEVNARGVEVVREWTDNPNAEKLK